MGASEVDPGMQMDAVIRLILRVDFAVKASLAKSRYFLMHSLTVMRSLPRIIAVMQHHSVNWRGTTEYTHCIDS